MSKVLSAIKDAVSSSSKRTHSSPPANVLVTDSNQENLDTHGMAKILVIGETGSGKSTFINYLTNYFRRGNLQNLKISIPSKYHPITTESFTHQEYDVQNTSHSKTNSCHQYMFAHDSKQYLFLDTPGLADTRGAEQDDKNIVSIIDSVENLGGLTTVIIVVNGAICRLTVNLRNVIARLRGNLPDIVMDNVILVLTNTNQYGANFNIKAFQLNGNVYPYYMQNSAFSQDPSTWDTSARESLQKDWDQAMNEIAAMLQTIDTFKTKSVTAFKTMKGIRNEIKARMHEAQIEVSQIQKMQDEIAACEVALKNADNNLIQFKDYKRERVVESEKIVDAPFHSTLCQKCNHVCHNRCRLNETTIVGDQILQGCWAFKDGLCTQCQSKCPYNVHYHAKKTMQKTKEKLEDVLADIKAKYDMASNDKSDYQKKITSTADAKKMLQKALDQKNEDIKQLCSQLHQICTGFNIAQELHALIDQLETESMMLKNIEAKQQAGVFIRSLKEFCSIMEKDQSATQQRLPQMKIINTERPIQCQVSRPSSAISSIQSSQIKTADASEYNTSSNSHIDEEVLATLRAIGKKKAAKSKTKSKVSKKSVETSSEAEEESDISTNESSNEEDENDNKGKKQRNSKNKKQESTAPVSASSPVTIDQEQLKELTINELLTRYRSCTDDRLKNFFIYELKQRSDGKSVGPLKTAATIAEFTADSQKYCTLGLKALKKEHEKLKQRINEITEPDILRIDQVPSALLIEIAALQTLIERAPPEESAKSEVHLQSTQQQSMQMSSNCQNDYNAMHHDSHTLNINRPANTYPNVQTNERQQFQSSLPVLPHRYHTNSCHNPCTCVPPPPYTSPHQQSFQPIHRPDPIRPHAPSDNIQDRFDQLHINPENYNHSYSPESPSYPSVSTDITNGLISRANLGAPDKDDTHKDIRHITNVQLLSKYQDALAHRNHEQGNVLYNELKRRCYGDHLLLLKEKSELFNNIFQANQNRSLAELTETHSRIIQKIRTHLTNGDATHLNDIPTDLIVEAGTIARLISAKSL